MDGIVSLAKKPFGFGVDPDHYPDAVVYGGIFANVGYGQL